MAVAVVAEVTGAAWAGAGAAELVAGAKEFGAAGVALARESGAAGMVGTVGVTEGASAGTGASGAGATVAVGKGAAVQAAATADSPVSKCLD